MSPEAKADAYRAFFCAAMTGILAQPIPEGEERDTVPENVEYASLHADHMMELWLNLNKGGWEDLE